MKKIIIDQNLCIGCGSCVSICPEVFELGDDSKSHIKKNADLDKNEQCIKESVSACPVQAISAE